MPPANQRPMKLGAVSTIFLVLFAGCLQDSPFEPTPRGWNWMLGPNVETVTFEIDYATGHAPSQVALDGLSSVARQVHGEVIVKFAIQELSSVNGKEWALGEVRQLEKATRDSAEFEMGLDMNLDAAHPALHYLVLPGRMNEDFPPALGFYDSVQHYVAIFPDGWRDQLLGNEIKLIPRSFGDDFTERAVFVHEYGHSLGLVNCGIGMQTGREHPDSRCHSSSQESVMWPGVSHDFGWAENLRDNEFVPYRFDADDLADIRAHQEFLASP